MNQRGSESDINLLYAARRGDKVARRQLIERMVAEVESTVAQRGRQRIGLELSDLKQIACVYAIEAIDSGFNPELSHSLVAYIKAKISVRFRRDRIQSLLASNVNCEVKEFTLDFDLVVNDKEPDDTMAKLNEAVDSLPESLRNVVIRRRLQQQPFDEISRECGTPINKLRILDQRAIRMLKDKLAA